MVEGEFGGNAFFCYNQIMCLGRLGKKLSAENLFKKLVAFTVIWYIAVSLAHLCSQRPLWNDEMCVFYSIEQFNFREMFSRPLLSIQVFPRVYLFFIQQFSGMFDFHLIALRFLPFVCMMAAFGLWLRIASYEFKNKIEYMTFAMSWPASALLIYYSAELKQYSMDVLAGAVFILFLYHQEKLMQEKRVVFYAALALLPFLLLFSYISVFFLLLPLYQMILYFREDRKVFPAIVLYGLVLAGVAAAAYQFDIRLRETGVLTQEWRNYFISTESVTAFLRSLTEGIMKLFCYWFAERPKIIKQIGIFFSVLGFFYLFAGFFRNIRKDRYYIRSLETIPFILFMESLFLGALKKYPFVVPRTSLFFCPIVLFLIIRGIVSLKSIDGRLYRLVHCLYLAFLAVLMVALSRFAFAGTLGFRPVLW